MALIEYDLMGEKHDKVKTAIDRLQAFCPLEGYYLCFSGGKDSCVIKALADMAGVKYDAHYNATTVDPPELVRFIIAEHPDVKIEKPEKSMRKLIIENKMPPTRSWRYCCRELKESKSPGRINVTGVRWNESRNRKNNSGVITIFNGKGVGKDINDDVDFKVTDKGGVVLNNDNSESRKLVERCYINNTTNLNPIVDWSTEDVWEFIHEYKIKYCKLYDEGMSRLGCIGCPLAKKSKRIYELRRWPQYERLYLSAFDEMIQARKKSGLDCQWETADEVMKSWLSESRKETNQLSLFETIEMKIDNE